MSLPSIPKVELLKHLVPTSLKQSLPKALRLWIILQSLYGEADQLSDRFTYKDWETHFFSHSHKVSRDAIAAPHDPNCACAHSLEQWLFDSDLGTDRTPWTTTFCELYATDLQTLQTLFNKSDRLFAITGRSLENDFESLVKLGYLTFQNKPDGKPYKNRYQKLATPPAILTAENSTTAAEFIQTDLSEFVDSLAQPLQGIQRFFLHAEYVVANQFSDRVSDYQIQLKETWNQPETSPMYLHYISAREFQEEFHWIIYPVCVFYYQRAPYLFGYGYQKSDRPTDPITLQWYDFRLDHIAALKPLDWDDRHIHPTFLTQRQQPPTPDHIHRAMAETWGFEFYRPSDSLILRFDRYFYANYIEPTERAALFTPMRLPDLLTHITRLPDPTRQTLQQVLSQRNSADIYCRVNYRVGDRNILMRLRAWGPNVEVILPYALREQIATETQQLSQMYKIT